MAPTWQRCEVTLSPPATAADAALAAQFGVALAARRDPTVWQLVRSVRGLTLCPPDASGLAPIAIDPGTGPFARRLRTSRRDEPLAKAIGLPKRQELPSVVDATAGLCRDAMVLAHLGCRVVALERAPALALLAAAAVQGSTLADRLSVAGAEAGAWLAALSPADAPDVVYLDPMFDEPGRAQVKLDMQVCRALVAPTDDTAALLAVARAVARHRVVVKRHPHLPPLADGVSFRVDGNRVRFDVYLTPAAPARSP